jgi:hypothetical protein
MRAVNRRPKGLRIETVIANAPAFANIASTGMRPVSAQCRLALARVAAGGRLVRTSRGYTLFDENGRYLGTVLSSDPSPEFGPVGKTVLLKRD